MTPIISLPYGIPQAGQALFVHAAASTFDDNVLFHTVRWDFGDGLGAVPSPSMDGYTASHIYSLPGTYQVKLTIRHDNGQQWTATKSVVVPSSTRKRYFVSSTGLDTNTGLDAEHPITWNKARSLINSNTEILLKCGDTFRVSRYDNVVGLCKAFTNLQYTNVRIGSYGTGAKPRIEWIEDRAGRDGVLFATSKTTKYLCIDGLEITCPAHENETIASKFNFFVLNFTGTNAAIVNCTIGATGQFVQATAGNAATTTATNIVNKGLLIQGNNAPSTTGLHAYFAYLMGIEDVVIAGNSIANVTREHVVRFIKYNRVTIYNNVLHNIERKEDPDDIANCSIRFYGNPKAGDCNYVSRHVYISKNDLMGKVWIGQNGSQTDWTPTCPVIKDTMFRENLIGYAAPPQVLAGAFNVRITENVVRNAPNAIYIDPVWDMAGSPNFYGYCGDIWIDHNTFDATAYSSSNSPLLTVVRIPQRVYFRNNLLFNPNSALRSSAGLVDLWYKDCDANKSDPLNAIFSDFGKNMTVLPSTMSNRVCKKGAVNYGTIGWQALKPSAWAVDTVVPQGVFDTGSYCITVGTDRYGAKLPK